MLGVTSRARNISLFALLGFATALVFASGCAAGVMPPEEGGDEPASGGTTLPASGRAGQNGFSVAGSSTPEGGSASGGAPNKGGAASTGGALGGAGQAGAPSGGANAVAGSSAGGAVGSPAGSPATGGSAAGSSAAGGSSSPTCVTEQFSYNAGKSLSSVHLSGSFNAWAEPGLPLTHEAGEVWKLSLDLAAGNYEYKFVLDGTTWVSDPANPNTANDTFGGVNSLLTVVCP